MGTRSSFGSRWGSNREDLYTVNASSLHYAILRHLVDRGYAPSAAWLAREFAVGPEEMASALLALERMHGVVLHPHQAEVWIAHPFSTAPTGFAVKRGGTVWWGNCAWCSLGVAALAGGNGVTIQTTLGGEGEPVTIQVEGDRIGEDLWVHFPIPMSRAWENVVYTCSMMLVFANEAAIDEWCVRHSLPRGDAQPIQRAYDFARVWYGRHLDPDWTKWTVDEAREIFARFGFHGPVWELPESGQRF